MLFIYLATLFILFLWLTKMILLKKIILKKSFWDIPILLFFLSQLLSTFLSIDFHTSIFGYYGRFNGGLLSILSYLILYYALISNYEDFGKNYLENLLRVILVGSLIVIFWGLPGKFGYDLSCFLFSGQLNNSCWTAQFKPAERLFSTLGQPNWLGAYLAITFFIGFYFFFKTRNTKYLILNTLYLIFNFLTLLFTRSRSSLIAVGAGLLIFIPTYFFLIEKNFKKILVIMLLLLFTLGICKSGITQIDRFFELKTYQTKKITAPVKTEKKTAVINSDITESGDIRKIVWQGAIDLGKKYPLFGTGVETFAYAYYFVRPQAHNLTSEWDYLYNKAHNEYLNYFATTGFIGLGTYLILILVLIIFSLYKLKTQTSNVKTKSQNSNLKNDLKIEDLDLSFRILVLSLLCSYLTILITNFFGFSTTVINLFFYLIPAFMLMVFSSEKIEEKNSPESSFDKTGQKIGFTIVFLLFLSGLIYIVRYWLADINYAQGDNYYKIGNYQSAAYYFEQALKLRYEHVYEDKFSYVLANLAFISAYQKQIETAKRLIDLANYYNKKSLAASPQNSLYWKTKAKNDYLFYQISQDPKMILDGIEALKIAKKLAPTDPKIPYSLSIFYSLLADEEKNPKTKKEYLDLSIKEAKETVNLKPNDQGYKNFLDQLVKKYQ
jgi:O-antigen ligase